MADPGRDSKALRYDIDRTIAFAKAPHREKLAKAGRASGSRNRN